MHNIKDKHDLERTLKIIILKLTIFILKTILSGLQNIYRNNKINFELIIMENRIERWK